MTVKKWLAAVALTSFLVTALVCVINYVIDPLQHYRKASWYKPCYCADARYLNPGLAKNFDYNSIIIGTSTSENFVPSHVDSRLNIKVLKLTMRGASAFEEGVMMQTAINTGKVKNVIYGLDLFSFMETRDDSGTAKGRCLSTSTMTATLTTTGTS